MLTYFSSYNGSPVVISDCNNDHNQLWTIHDHAISAYNGSMCLEVTDGDNSDGAKVQIWGCSPGNVNQQWDYDRLFLFWGGKKRCLDLTDGSTENGSRLQIWECLGCVEASNFCLITDSRDPESTTIKARFRSLLLCCERLTLGALLVWHLASP